MSIISYGRHGTRFVVVFVGGGGGGGRFLEL